MKKKEKKIIKYEKTIQQHITKKDFVKILLNFQNIESGIYGYIQLQSKKFILLQINNEFSLDGYAIILKRKLKAIRCNKYDKTSNKIHRAEGTLQKQYKVPDFISLENWEQLFSSLKDADLHVIIECEDQEEADFFIGPLQKTGKNSVSILNYDPTGQFDKKPSKISYKDITKVTFGDQYSTVFRKYLK